MPHFALLEKTALQNVFCFCLICFIFSSKNLLKCGFFILHVKRRGLRTRCVIWISKIYLHVATPIMVVANIQPIYRSFSIFPNPFPGFFLEEIWDRYI